MIRSRWAIVLLLVLGLAACSDDDHVGSPFGDKETETEDRDLGAISGLVVDAAGAPLPYAGLTVGDREGFADAQGRFFVTDLELDESSVRFDKDTRTTTNYRALQLVAGGEVHFPGVMLLPLDRGAVFFADAGGTAEVGALGSGAVFADSSFAGGDGVYTDRVGAFMAVATVGEPDFAAAFPGDFRGARSGGQEVPFDALGVIWTFIDSQAGRLDLAPGKTVRYRLGVAGPAPATAVAWSLDLATGRWVEIGESTLSDGVYEIEVASLAPVCWAVPAVERCAVSGTVTDGTGRPLANTRVECRDLAGRFREAMMTGADGGFSLGVPRTDGAQVSAYFGSIGGPPATVSTVLDCPAVLAEPLVITLPDVHIDLVWTAGYGDLDVHYLVAGGWSVDYVSRGSLTGAPYAELQDDEREGGSPEAIAAQRWYDGVNEYWVHDYQNRSTAALRASGALVLLEINDETWSFTAADAVFDPAESDSGGWWHVFDVVVDGSSVVVDTVQVFAPAPAP